jgi:hypothetical protein
MYYLPFLSFAVVLDDFAENVELASDFVLHAAVLCEVAGFATVVAILVIFLLVVALAEVSSKLFLWVALMNSIKVY